MPESIEKPEDRSIEELMEGMVKGAKDMIEGRTKSVEEFKEQNEKSE